MQIQRDYSQPFFGSSRRRRGRGRLAFIVLILLAGVAFAIYSQRDLLQLMALDALGMAPIPTPLSVELATDAMNAYVVGDLKNAAAYWEQALSQRPEDVDYIHEYGRVLIEMEDYERAITLGDRAITANSFDPRGFALKASALIFADRAAEALPVALAGIEADRRYAPLYASMGRAYVNLGNLPAAIENAEEAVALDPQDSDVRRSYAYALSAVAEHEAAISELTLAVMLDPGNIPAQMELAFQYLASNRDLEAIALYDQIIAQQPLNARAMLRLCSAYLKVGQFIQAIDTCERAVDTDPTYVSAQFRLAMLLYTERNYAEAQEGFSACVELEPNNIECKYRLGLTHYYLGDCDNGWRILQESMEQAQQEIVADDVISNIRLGLGAMTQNCAAYSGFSSQFPGGVQPTPTEDPNRGPQQIDAQIVPVIELTPAPTESSTGN